VGVSVAGLKEVEGEYVVVVVVGAKVGVEGSMVIGQLEAAREKVGFIVEDAVGLGKAVLVVAGGKTGVEGDEVNGQEVRVADVAEGGELGHIVERKLVEKEGRVVVDTGGVDNKLGEIVLAIVADVEGERLEEEQLGAEVFHDGATERNRLVDGVAGEVGEADGAAVGKPDKFGAIAGANDAVKNGKEVGAAEINDGITDCPIVEIVGALKVISASMSRECLKDNMMS